MTEPATGLVLHPPEGTSYHFDPGTLCLEFLTTGGPGALARHEVLHEPGNLAGWLALSRLRLDPSRVQITADELLRARRLRDALWRLARGRAQGHPDGPDDLATVNDAATGAPLVPRFAPDGARVWTLPATGGQAVSTLARDAIDLFTGPFANRIRECGAHDCYLIFVDTSRPGRRRWCAMERCGNRHKVRALRARRELEEAPTS
ncbi:CGNR zinc finger domain-containing protein [Streptomyces sp. H10-C2]|uniref:CGNR zinc finger domain-containing protein n=1 Tax=unclassified Streptomyces TaxID=2593676 RepID=UPI0024BA92A9|nr:MULTISPECIES: CGNR zinc finger domain-containing protein [unclassified Streptomyces]MDJ0344076.1 CGNR zinc finger domain-containing protein [Streptomyces sp. PH10-H1]MDJ0368615.1 CGNR zinc finger domain-containing protein [Streptomyces sp. H10-C2]